MIDQLRICSSKRIVMKPSIRSAAIFNLLFVTKFGSPAKDVHFNTVLNVWLGNVAGVPHAWDTYGKCIDRSRRDLDLF